MFSSPTSFKVLPMLIGLTILCSSILLSQAGAYCKAHQYYSGSRCEECDATCDECTYYTPSYCSNCTDGYRNSSSNSCSFTCPSTSQFLNFNDQTCGSCASWCTRGCIEARDNCNLCYSGEYYRPDLGNCSSTCPQYGGFYASSSENRCIPCRDPNCLRCSSNGDCIECKSFWNLNSTTGRCSRKCPTGCKFCTESGVCTQCEFGWSMTASGTCSCSQINCRECGSRFCARCQEGYVKDDRGDCMSTISNCRQYNSSTTCEICEPGYYLSYGKYCYACKTGCRHCVSENTNCTACDNGYYLNTTYYTRYPTCLLKTSKSPTPTPDPYTPSSSGSGWMIALLVGGVMVILIIVSVIVAQAKKKRQAAAAQLDESSASAVAYAQMNNDAASAYPAFQQPGGYSAQQIFYPTDQKDRDSNFYYPSN